MMVKSRTTEMIRISLMAVIMTISAWLTIPFFIPFTLQTFGVFLTMKILGGKKGTVSIAIYILLALVGIPVLSGFRGGLEALIGLSGGYIIGFLGIGLFYWLVKPFNKSRITDNLFLAVGLIICYGIGTVWFVFVTEKTLSAKGILQAVSICVFPYIIPDVLKLILADIIANRLRKTEMFH